MNEADTHSRDEVRRRTFKEGLVSFDHDRVSARCMVRNLAETGAKLQFDGPVHLPDAFNLTIPLDGVKYPAEMRWREGTTCGVEFTGPAEPSDIHHDQALDLYVPGNRPEPETDLPAADDGAQGRRPAPKKVFGRLR